MTTLYIIRHAEAEGNLYRRCQGHYDGRVTSNGRMQIDALRGYCSSLRIDALYSSDLSRTRETSGALTENGLSPILRPGLREICLGVWENMPWGLIMREYPAQYDAFLRGFGFSLTGAETCEQARERVLAEVESIVSDHLEQTVAIVSHGMVMRLLLCALSGLPPEDISKMPHLDNASITTVTWEDGPEIVKLGENSYLGELSTFGRQNWWRGDSNIILGKGDVNLWFRPTVFPKDRELVTAMKREAWKAVYDTGENFDENRMPIEAEYDSGLDPRAVQFAMLGDRPVGLLHISPDVDCAPDECHISLFYLREAYCGKRLGIQLLGEAVSIARKNRKSALRLRVWEKNERARAFYMKHGFSQTDVHPGVFGTLIVMRKEIC